MRVSFAMGLREIIQKGMICARQGFWINQDKWDVINQIRTDCATFYNKGKSAAYTNKGLSL
jgi:hypothetical protein